MAADEYEMVAHITPVDVSGVRDPGMQALILLAVSLGWNIMKKHNQPVVLTARNGHQVRLPTNTSIRMSVYQSRLASILVHSEDMEPSMDLVNEIIALTKVSRDHQRMLRFSVGETPAERRRRLDEVPAATKHRDEEHLTQRVKVPDEVTVAAMDELAGIEWEDPDDDRGLVFPYDDVTVLVPADNGDHGNVVSREPYMATAHRDTSSKLSYESDTSYERVWEDGFKDYECMLCGKAYTTPRGVGGHKGWHMDRGEIPRETVPARNRAEHVEKVRVERQPKPEPMSAVAAVMEADDEIGPARILDMIRDLVAGPLVAENASLRRRLAEAEAKLTAMDADNEALIELLTSRKRGTDG